MGERLRFALIGAGRIAGAYAAAFERIDLLVPAAVVDPCREAAVALARRLRCPAFSSTAEMLARCEVDAAVVCTPPVTHPAVTLELLSAGKHVLCEKPLSIDVADARAMIEAAYAGGVCFTMASKFRYVPDVLRAKEIVDAGGIGEIALFENAFTGCVDMRHRWNADPRVSGGGVLIDNGTHAVDLMRYFLGPIVDLRVIEGKRLQGLPVEETVSIHLRSAEGVLGSIDLSWSIDKHLEHYLTIHGTKGTLRVGWQGSKRWRNGEGGWEPFGTGYDKIEAFTRQIEN
ncbi:MAG: gfo/Idh/MocA family oxidoreductase, partial [Deltaproteobacteria bacterium]